MSISPLRCGAATGFTRPSRGRILHVQCSCGLSLMEYLFSVIIPFCFGACFGSFGNVCVWRFPRPGLSPASPRRSLCPRCGFLLPWFDNIPVVSRLVLGGSCRSCGGTISLRYTIVELVTAVLFVLMGLRFLQPVDFQIVSFIFWSLLFWGLVIAAFIDLELMLLPDEIIFPFLGLVPWFFFFYREGTYSTGDGISGAFAALFRGGEANETGASLFIGNSAMAVCAVAGFLILGEYARRRGGKRTNPYKHLTIPPFYLLGGAYGLLLGKLLIMPAGLAGLPGMSFVSSLLGILAGVAIIWGIRFAGKYMFAQEAMGFGDLKLMALLGAVTGVAGVFMVLIIASVVGSLVGILRYLLTGERDLPFGPLLIVGALVVFLWRHHLEELLQWYSSQFHF